MLIDIVAIIVSVATLSVADNMVAVDTYGKGKPYPAAMDNDYPFKVLSLA